MSAEREELAGLLFTTDNSKSVEPWSEWERCKNEPRLVEYVYAMADTILAAGYRKPHTITTADEIKDLPALTMVVHDDMANGGPLEVYVVPDDGTVMFKDRYPFHLLCMNGDYVQAEDMPLPLTVVYEVGK